MESKETEDVMETQFIVQEKAEEKVKESEVSAFSASYQTYCEQNLNIFYLR